MLRSSGRKFQVLVAIAALTAVSNAVLCASAWAGANQDKLVVRAESTLKNFLNDPDMTWLQRNIANAKGIVIAPEVTRAGFIVGGSGGRAVLLARAPDTSQWVGPSFYTLATASVGFQAGVDVSEVVMLVMSEKGLNSLMSTSFKLGGDASVAAGPVGAGAKSDVTADFISFSRAKGVYAGLNLDGTVVKTSNEWDKAYYKKTVTPPDIIMRHSVSNAQAQPLRQALEKASGK
jgi:SH3 domain-containing YSC84-like protein 1